MQDDLADRVEALETRVAYQDQTVDDLNKTVTAQWERIDKLSRELTRLADRLQQAEDRSAPTGPEPPPPHY
jgi:SlyX protein